MVPEAGMLCHPCAAAEAVGEAAALADPNPRPDEDEYRWWMRVMIEDEEEIAISNCTSRRTRNPRRIENSRSNVRTRTSASRSTCGSGLRALGSSSLRLG